jgi:hypothetical protein
MVVASSSADRDTRSLGVTFTREPLQMGPVTTAILDDTCGNLIQIATMTPRRSALRLAGYALLVSR